MTFVRPSLRPVSAVFVAVLALCSARLVGGCSGDSANQGATGSTTSGAGGACEPGSHAGSAGECEQSLTSWTDAPPLIEKRDHQATFVAESDEGDFLYVLGGVQDNSTLLSSVELSPIAEDGSLGAWTAGSPLPEVMAGHMIATVDRTVVVTGGYRQTAGGAATLSNKTELATVGPDGSLGPWTEGPHLSVGRFHHAMASYEGSLYVIGGLTGDNTSSTPNVERAVVSSDGVVGEWVQLTPLPVSRSHHSVAVADGALYVTAGLTGDPATAHEDFKDVLRAPIMADGTLGDWATVGELPTTLGTHSSFAHLGYLYVVGGIENNSVNTKEVRRAAIGADGMLGAWESMAPLPKAHAHQHHSPYHKGFVYSAGGAYDHASTTDVFVGRFE